VRLRFEGLEIGDDLPLFVESFEPGGADIRGTVMDRPQRDGVIPGREFRGMRTWGLSIATNTSDLQGALEQDALLASRWLDPKYRVDPLTMVPLSYELGGRWRRVYGRPGQYQGVDGGIYSVQGVGQIDCDFRVMDLRHFDDVEKVVTLPIVPASTGGLMAPLVAPLSTVRSSEPRVGLVNNTGHAPTPLKVVFRGPVTNPYVRSLNNGWEIALQGSLAYDQSVVVDSFAGTVMRGRTPVAGWLTRKTRLSSAVLPVGMSDISFGGEDPTGTATVELRWRPAYYSI